MHAIRAENLTRRFGSLAAVDRLSFTVAEGEIFGLVGPDGAGKTTTMRLLDLDHGSHRRRRLGMAGTRSARPRRSRKTSAT